MSNHKLNYDLYKKKLKNNNLILLDDNTMENNKQEKQETHKFIDLFCGIGGFHVAIKRINEENICILACDIDKKCKETYKINFDIEPINNIKDINEKELSDSKTACLCKTCAITKK